MATSKVGYLVAAIAIGLVIPRVSLPGQSSPPSTLKLTTITFTGLQQYSQQLALGSCGLQVGQTVKVADLDAAIEHLMASGLFKTAHYRYTYTGNRADILFDVQEEKWDTPVVFDNFIWFSDQELNAAIKKKFSFFQGPAPNSAGVLEAIKDQLEDFLTTRGMPKPVEYIFQMDQYGRNSTLIFSVKGDLPVCDIQFLGADQSRVAELLKSAAHFIFEPYSRSTMDFLARSELVSIYQKYGFLKAKFESCQARPSPNGTCQGAVVTLIANEGAQYKWHGAVWEGNQALTAGQLNNMLGMKEGEIANVQKIADGQKAVTHGYGRQGYLGALVRPRQEFQDDSRLVTYHFTVNEGLQFRMGKLIVNGLSDAEADKVKSLWKLAEGAVIDIDYVSDFARKNLRPRDIGFAMKKYEINFKFNKQTAVADVALTIQK